jgi:hypothetical protein
MKAVEPVAAPVVAVPYRFLLNARIVLPPEGDEYVKVDRHFFQFCLRPILERIEVDEEWYLSKYPDVLTALEDGAVPSAAAHYVRHGYFENRMPYPIEVDEEWYLEQYPDVRTAIERNTFASAQAHFDIAGFAEGRLPYAGFALATLPNGDDTEAWNRGNRSATVTDR